LPKRLSLSTQLTIAIVPLVVLAAASVGYLGYRNLVTVAIERTLATLDANARSRAWELGSLIANVRADVNGFRAIIGLDELIALSGAPGTETAGGRPLQELRERIGQRLAGELEFKPDISNYRVIGAAHGGREIVRVDRDLQSGKPRIAPDNELQSKAGRTYFDLAMRAKPGEVLVSQVELERGTGAAPKPPVPVLHVVTPLFAADGSRFGLIVANIDMRGVFARLSGFARNGRVIYVVNDRGDYLLHPDKEREFGFERNQPDRIQDDFPSIADAITARLDLTSIIADRNGVPTAVAVDHADGVPLSIVEAVPQQRFLNAIMTAWRDSTLIGGAFAALIATLLAIIMARTMTKPLSQMTAAVSDFTNDRPGHLPVDAGGEIGVLARTFEQMVQQSQDHTAEIRREKETFESIMNAMAEAILLIDQAGNVIYENPGAVKLRSAAGLPALPWSEAIEPFLEDGVTPLPLEGRPGWRALHGQTVDQIELVLRIRNTDRSVEVIGNAQPIRNAAGKIRGAVVVYKDITKLKEAERRLHQAQKLEAIGQLTGGVAHDFNNMLTVINGTAELLIDELADRPDLSSIARMIEQAAERGADLTRQLLAFARKQPLHPRNVDVNAIVSDTQQLLKATIGEHIDVAVQLELDVDAARIDPSQLSSALLNLSVNARDAMPNGGKLLLETTTVVLDEAYAARNPDVQPGRYVMIAVSDTGTGIPAELRDKVFEPFFTTKAAGHGTGLGLSMVYGFVKQSNGHIKLYSEEGHGTTIKLYLPRADAEIDSDQAAMSSEGGSETILLVEDDELVRKFAVAQLEGLGYRPIAVSDGQAALKEAERGTPFDLLFTDVIMPGGLNGPQLADAIAQIRPVKVLYTSGYTESAVVHHGRLAPGVLLLPKPYRKADLARMVRAALGNDNHVPADIDDSPRASWAG